MKNHIVKMVVFTVGFNSLVANACEAQSRLQGAPSRQPSSVSSSGGVFGKLPTSEYLQKEIRLTNRQLQRINEIELQMQGTRALSSPAVQKALGISDKQKKEIETARRSTLSAMREFLRQRRNGKRPNFDEMRKRFAEAREKADKAVLKVLTPLQTSKWKKMLGKPVDRKKLNGRNRRGRPDV